MLVGAPPNSRRLRQSAGRGSRRAGDSTELLRVPRLDDCPVERICELGHIADGVAAACAEVDAAGNLGPFRQHRNDVLGDGQASRQARRFDSEEVYEPGSVD